MIVRKSSTPAGVPYREDGVNIGVERCQCGRRNTQEDHMARTRSTTAKAKPAAKQKTEAEMMEAVGIVPGEETPEQPKAKKVREVGPATQKVIDHIRELY